MGSFLVFYTETEGIILNVVVCLAAIAACGYSFFQMSNCTGLKLRHVLRRSLNTFLVQVVAVLIAALLVFLMGIFMDLIHLPMSWFTHSWLILGLYFCPLFFGFAIIPALYFHYTKDVSTEICGPINALLTFLFFRIVFQWDIACSCCYIVIVCFYQH